MLSFYQNLSIRNKILSGFGIVLVLLTVVAAVSFSTISDATSGFETYGRWANNTNTLGRLQANLLDARLAVKNFIQTGDEKFVDDFHTSFTNVHKFIDEGLAQIHDKVRHAKVEGIDKNSQVYDKAFADLAEEIKMKNSIVANVLDPTGYKIVDEQLAPLVSAGNANAVKATESMLYIRLLAMNYLAHDSKENVVKVKEKFSVLDKYLNILGSSSIKANADKYRDGFDLLVEKTNKINQLIAQLDEIGPEIAAISENLKLEYKTNQDGLGVELQNSNSAGSNLVIFVGIFAFIFGIGAAMFLAGLITKPIIKVMGTVEQLQTVCITNLGNGLTKLAVGDLDAQVEKATKHLKFTQTDEIGRMANSVDEMITKAHAGIDAYEVVRSKVRELSGEAVNLIQDAKNGQLDKRAEEKKFEGAYKEIIKGFNEVLDAVILPVQDGSHVLSIMATGDLTARVTNDYKGDHRKIKDSINQLGDSLENVLAQISEAIAATASASTQISSSSEEMAAGAQEQSAQSSEVAQAVEEMAKTILETTSYATTAAENSEKAGKVAEEGGQVVTQTIAGMNRIADVVSEAASTVEALGANSDKIGEIIQVIDDIADQTNLLALNAAIEAARAGEQGRGFAVVADEVRKLAERTTKATKEIADMIKTIQNDTHEAVTSINRGNDEVVSGKTLAAKAGESLKDIITSSNSVLSAITQVAAASEEQSTSAEQISKNIESINSVTHQSAAGVQQIARAAEDLNSLTNNLETLIAQFKLRTQNQSFKNYASSNKQNEEQYAY